MFDNPSFILIILCMTAGVLLRQTGKFPSTAPQALNGFLIWISLPAVILLYIPKLLDTLELRAELLIPISMAWIQLILASLFFLVVGRLLHWSRSTVGTLSLTAGLGNTSFVGFPLLESLHGEAGVQIGVIVDQPGSFLTLSTLGLVVASIYAPSTHTTLSALDVAKRVLLFPPFVGLLLALLWHLSGTYQEGVATAVLERLAAPLVPLALVAVGFQLKLSRAQLRRERRSLAVGLLFKLVLAPLFFTGLYVYLLGASGLIVKVTVLEAAMAPMVTAAVLVDDFDLNSELSGLMIGVGIPISVVTVPLWNELLRVIA